MTIGQGHDKDLLARIKRLQNELEEMRRLPRVKDSVVDHGFIKFRDDAGTLRVAIGHLEGLVSNAAGTTQYAAGQYGVVHYNSGGVWQTATVTS